MILEFEIGIKEMLSFHIHVFTIYDVQAFVSKPD